MRENVCMADSQGQALEGVTRGQLENVKPKSRDRAMWRFPQEPQQNFNVLHDRAGVLTSSVSQKSMANSPTMTQLPR